MCVVCIFTKELGWRASSAGSKISISDRARFKNKGLRPEKGMKTFDTLVTLDHALLKGLGRPLASFKLNIDFAYPTADTVRFWSPARSRWVWRARSGDTAYDIDECPDPVIRAHELPFVRTSTDQAQWGWAALSYMADPNGYNCHAYSDPDVHHRMWNNFLRACREADGFIMLSLERAQVCLSTPLMC